MLNINPATIIDELNSTQKLVQKWVTKLENIPVVDEPGSEEQLELFIREFAGEMRVCASKCGTLAEILLGD